eukprot:3936026-Rhodomonas_salina.1
MAATPLFMAAMPLFMATMPLFLVAMPLFMATLPSLTAALPPFMDALDALPRTLKNSPAGTGTWGDGGRRRPSGGKSPRGCRQSSSISEISARPRSKTAPLRSTSSASSSDLQPPAGPGRTSSHCQWMRSSGPWPSR